MCVWHTDVVWFGCGKGAGFELIVRHRDESIHKGSAGRMPTVQQKYNFYPSFMPYIICAIVNAGSPIE